MKNRQCSRRFAGLIQRHGENVHGGLPKDEKLAYSLVPGNRARNRGRGGAKAVGQLGRHSHGPVLLVVHHHAG